MELKTKIFRITSETLSNLMILSISSLAYVFDPNQSIRFLLIGIIIFYIQNRNSIKNKEKLIPKYIIIPLTIFFIYGALRLDQHVTFRSFQYYFGALLAVLTIVAILIYYSPTKTEAAAKTIIISYLLMIILSFLIIKMDPYYQSRILSVNRLSTAIGLLSFPVFAVLAFTNYERKRKAFLFLSISFGLFLYLTFAYGQSKILAVIVFIIAYFGAKIFKKKSLWLLAIMITGIIAIQPWWGDLLDATIKDTISHITRASASERIEIWRVYGSVLRYDPWWGLGFGASQDIEVTPIFQYLSQELKLGFQNRLYGFPVHAHNNFLQIWVELGLFGIISFWLFLMSVTWSFTNLNAQIFPYAFSYLSGVIAVALEYDRAWQNWWISMIGIGAIFLKIANELIRNRNTVRKN